MYIDNKIIDQLKNSADIVNIIGEYISLTKKGINYLGLCPFHQDTKPSLYVSPQKRMYKCFSCNKGGDIFSFIQGIEKINYLSAIKLVAKKSNFQNTYINNISSFRNEKKEKYLKINNEAAFYFNRMLYSQENKHALDYLYSRGLDNEQIKYFNIGFAPYSQNSLFKYLTRKDKDGNQLWKENDLIENGIIYLDSQNEYKDFFLNRIIFPIMDEYNNIVGFSGRSLSEKESVKYLNSKTNEFFKKDSLFYNMQNVIKNEFEKIYLVEGFFDVISMHKMGYKNVIGLMGTSFTNNHFEIIKKEICKTLVLALDNDDAGFKAIINITRILKPTEKVLMTFDNYPDSYKDLDSLIQGNTRLFHEKEEMNITVAEFFINKHFPSILRVNVNNKLSLINEVEDFIAEYGDLNLISYYSRILAEKTNLVFEDVKSKIESKIEKSKGSKNNIIYIDDLKKENYVSVQNNKNEMQFYNNSIKENYHSLTKTKKIENNYIDFEKANEDKMINLEKTLLVLMAINPKTTLLFKTKLNYMNLEKNNKEYKKIKNILNILYETNSNYSYKDVLKEIDKSTIIQNIKNEYRNKVLINISDIYEKKLFTISEIYDQSHNIIIELTKYMKLKNS
ncbi:MAG: DNA primase [Mycoplasmoidaceae bacterium]